jgi:hypothetical protein
VIATDVRDRLFLFDRLRAALPSAQLVDLATDRLLSHPDFVHASRGVITIGSSELDSCGQEERESGAPAGDVSCAATTDYQAILAHAIRAWAAQVPAAATVIESPPLKPVWHLVSRTGLTSSTADSAERPHAKAITKWSGYALAFIAIVVAGVALWTAWTTHGVKALRFERAKLDARPNATACIAAAACFIVIVTAERSGGILLPVGITLLIMMPWYLWRYVGGLAWHTVVTWICLLAAVFISLLFPLSLFRQPNFGASILTDDLAIILQRAALLWEGGLAYYTAICISVLTFLVLFILNIHATRTAEQHFTLLDSALEGNSLKCHYQSALEKSTLLLVRPLILIACILAAAEIWHLHLHGTRLTIFGCLSDATMLISLFIMTVLGLLFLVTAVGRAMGILQLCRLMLAAVTPRSPGPASQSEASDSAKELLVDGSATETPQPTETTKPPVLGFTKDLEKQPEFLPTPVLAWPGAGGPLVTTFQRATDRDSADFKRWATSLGELIKSGTSNDSTLVAAFALLAGEICLVQNAIVGVTLTTLAATGLAYAFPITDGDGLLLINLVTLTLTGLFAGFITMRFETDKVLSRILCNRDEKAKFTLPLFGYVAFPFAVLAIAIAIADIPGVLSWSGSIFSAILEFTKPAALR